MSEIERGLARIQTAARDAALDVRQPDEVLAVPRPGSPWYRVDPSQLALWFRADTPFEAWEAETVGLLEVSRGIQWLVGDALAFGEGRWGEKAAQVFDPYAYSFDSVTRMARTARAIDPARRRPNVSFGIHADVAALPEPEQERLLDLAAANGTRRDEMRVLVRATKQRLAREAAAALPAPQLGVDGIVLGVSDAASLPLPDRAVDLVVTSPPYALDKPYGPGDVEADLWPSFMREWLLEARRVTKLHGRLALNVPLDTSEPEVRPTYAQAVAAALAAGWAYQSTIVWHDGQTTKGGWALGSVSRPYHVSQVEHIALFSHGDWGPSSSNRDDISPDEWQVAGRGPWVFPGESHPWEGRPAAFPVELPRRLIRYLTRVDDVVLDPFLGSGTSAVAAYLLGRRCFGYDLDPACIASAGRRVALVARTHEGNRDKGGA